MSILDSLACRVGERGSQPNMRVASQCLDNPALLEEIVAALTGKDAKLLADCAEVLTEVAKDNPKLVAPHAQALRPLLVHKAGRVRWEAHHALALVSALVQEVIAAELAHLRQAILADGSVIVRDYAVDAVAGYASTDHKAAKAAYPVLLESLDTFEGKQAGHALEGLAGCAALLPERREELMEIALRYESSPRGVIKKAAKRLLKALK